MDRPHKRTMSYDEFVTKYTEVVGDAVKSWNNPDPQRRNTGVMNAELALAQADRACPEYVDRLALLGPELGGTVVGHANVQVGTL